MIHCQVGKSFSVDGDSILVNLADEFGIRHPERTDSCVDALNPQRTEVAFLCSAVAVGILHSFFYRLLCNRVEVTAGAPVTLGAFEDFFSPLF